MKDMCSSFSQMGFILLCARAAAAKLLSQRTGTRKYQAVQ
jgi:hypothetical protein